MIWEKTKEEFVMEVGHIETHFRDEWEEKVNDKKEENVVLNKGVELGSIRNNRRVR